MNEKILAACSKAVPDTIIAALMRILMTGIFPIKV